MCCIRCGQRRFNDSLLTASVREPRRRRVRVTWPYLRSSCYWPGHCSHDGSSCSGSGQQCNIQNAKCKHCRPKHQSPLRANNDSSKNARDLFRLTAQILHFALRAELKGEKDSQLPDLRSCSTILRVPGLVVMSRRRRATRQAKANVRSRMSWERSVFMPRTSAHRTPAEDDRSLLGNASECGERCEKNAMST